MALMIYLDANATTELAPEAREAMLACLTHTHGNPSSMHRAGRLARAVLDESRDVFSQLLGCRPHELTFTGSGTESDNLAILGLARAHKAKGTHLITCQTEHHAVLHAFDFLEKKEGFSVTYLPVSENGTLCPQTLAAALRPETTLVSIMTANNETGVLHPMEQISALCREAGVLLHSDGVQSFGKETLRTEPFDALSLTGHKFHGPKGAGLLFVRSGIALDSLHLGGAQEGQRRPGTENVAAIAGMTRAAQLSLERMESETASIAATRDLFEQELLKSCPDVHINGRNAPRLPNTSNVSFPGSDAESLLMALDLEGICASSGSACMVGSLQASHVLLAMKVPATQAARSLRFSFDRFITPELALEAVRRVARVWDRLRE
jgi:cysteine desulfurase